MKVIFGTPLFIFEGPDGSGKTTAAIALARAISGNYTHHGPYPDVKEMLSAVYLDSMLPAIRRIRPVVLDRCWISEIPYGEAFRGGVDRVGAARYTLEHIAARCTTIYVRCDPTWEQVERNFVLRKGNEYLKTYDQMQQVFKWYQDNKNHPQNLRIVNVNLLSRSIDENIELLEGYL